MSSPQLTNPNPNPKSRCLQLKSCLSTHFPTSDTRHCLTFVSSYMCHFLCGSSTTVVNQIQRCETSSYIVTLKLPKNKEALSEKPPLLLSPFVSQRLRSDMQLAEASPLPSSPTPSPPPSGHFLCLGAAGSRPGSHPHVPVRHHFPPDLPPQLFHHLLGLHGVGHRHLPPGALRLLPAAPRQRRPCLHTKLRFSINVSQASASR